MHISVFDAVTLSVTFKVRLTEKAWPVLHVIVTLSPMTYDVSLLSTVMLLAICIAGHSFAEIHLESLVQAKYRYTFILFSAVCANEKSTSDFLLASLHKETLQK